MPKKMKSVTLAINGGTPVRTAPWGEGPSHHKCEIEALRKVLAGPALPLARSEPIMKFRAAAAKLYGAAHVVTTSSGTTALQVAIEAAGVGPGDEVIVPTMTDMGTFCGIFALNAIPVFCDAVAGGLVMDAEKLPALITRRTRAIVPVHNGGYVADMPAIMRLARAHKIKVVEDCAQAHLSAIGDRYLGTFGHFGCFSTNDSKHMRSGEGGFVLCRSLRDAQHMELYADKCYRRFPGAPKTPAFPPLNVRWNAVLAAVALEQIRMLPAWVEQRRRVGDRLLDIIRDYPLLPHPMPAKAAPSYWWFAFRLDQGRCQWSPEAFAKALIAEGLPCRRGPQPNTLQWELFRKLHRDPRSFRNYRPGPGLRKGAFDLRRFPETARSRRTVLTIPVNQHITLEDTDDVRRVFDKVFANMS